MLDPKCLGESFQNVPSRTRWPPLVTTMTVSHPKAFYFAQTLLGELEEATSQRGGLCKMGAFPVSDQSPHMQPGPQAHTCASSWWGFNEQDPSWGLAGLTGHKMEAGSRA
jgi:hypothetical protein